MKKVFCLLAGGALLTLANTASIAQPRQLTNAQMDGVTAGAVGLANAVSTAIGDAFAETVSQTFTEINTATTPHYALGQAASQGLAGSLVFQASSASHAETAASLP